MPFNNRAKEVRWSGESVFVLAAAGAGAGLGHLWRFPELAASNGGGAFVLIYVACLLLLGAPLLLAEMITGRAARRSPLHALRHVGSAAGGRLWALLGWAGILVTLLVAATDSVIGAWALYFLGASLSGHLATPSDAANPAMTIVPAAPWILLGLTVLVLIATWMVRRGVTRGVELVARVCMPILLGLLALLLVLAALGLGLGRALDQLLQPDWTAVTLGSVWAAMGHAIFTLGVGMGVVMAYGAYLPATASASRLLGSILALDLVITLGMALLLVAFASSPGGQTIEGAALLFGSAPQRLAGIPFGFVVIPLLFLLVVLAAFVSIVTLFEPVLTYLVEEYNARRPRVAVTWAVFCWVLGAVVVLLLDGAPANPAAAASGALALDSLGRHLLLLGVLGFAVFAGWVLPAAVVGSGVAAFGAGGIWLWRFWVGVVIPAGIAAALMGRLLPAAAS